MGNDKMMESLHPSIQQTNNNLYLRCGLFRVVRILIVEMIKNESEKNLLNIYFGGD